MKRVAGCGLRVLGAVAPAWRWSRWLTPLRGASSLSPKRTLNPQPATRHLIAALFVILAGPALQACPVCWGSPDDPMVKGVNSGIWVLLGLVAFVQIGFVAMFWSFWRKGREHRRFRESLRVIEGGPQA